MSSRVSGFVLVLLFLVPAVATEIPAGAEIDVRLKTRVGSDTSKAKDEVEAVVISPVLAADRIVIPAGTVLRGHVQNAKATAKADERALLDMEFCELVQPDGKNTKVETKVADVDNAREIVDEKGQILGILASETLSARMDQGLEKLGQRSSALAGILQGVKGAVVNAADSEITYRPGVEMTLKLIKPVQLKEPVGELAASKKLEPIASESQLFEMVNAQPYRTKSESGRESDMTNLMFIGSRQQLEAAFTAAGWAAAADINKQTALETFRAIAELRGYKEAPMSVLLLDGQKPDLNLQKQNNTFAQRHHLRVWRRQGTFDGRDIWVCAATHDIGIDFSQENRTFIHKIDPQVDRERAKVVNDLLFTDLVKSLALVDRPQVPRETQNATGDNLMTDGKMAVLVFQP